MKYTSDSEFDVRPHVSISNEIPPYDMYDGVNRVLAQSDYWKWFLGYSIIEHDLPLAKDPYKVNLEDPNQAIKIVNAEIMPNYGPKPKRKFDPNNPNANKFGEIYEQPTYHYQEENGVLLPEHSLLIHEFYRYLSTLYPDHPDWRHLLTNNEINDMFVNAGAMVDYVPDNRFFELLVENLPRLTNEEAQSTEAFKIKLRNLTNNAFRRKFYGSIFGYKMFANDIFQHTSIFSLGSYQPIRPIPLSEFSDNTYDLKQNKTNKWSSLYGTKFKLIDWEGGTNVYQRPTEIITEFNGIVLPGMGYNLFEFPNFQRNQSSLLNDASIGAIIESNYYDKSQINYLTEHISYNFPYRPEHIWIWNENFMYIPTSNYINYVQTSQENKVVYTKATIHKEFLEILLYVTDPSKILFNLPDVYESSEFDTDGSRIEYIYDGHFDEDGNFVNKLDDIEKIGHGFKVPLIINGSPVRLYSYDGQGFQIGNRLTTVDKFGFSQWVYSLEFRGIQMYQDFMRFRNVAEEYKIIQDNLPLTYKHLDLNRNPDPDFYNEFLRFIALSGPNIYRQISKFIDVIVNPFEPGSFILRPSEMIKYYPSEFTAEKNVRWYRDNLNESRMLSEFYPSTLLDNYNEIDEQIAKLPYNTDINEDPNFIFISAKDMPVGRKNENIPIQIKDVITLKNVNQINYKNNSYHQVTGFTKGWINYSINDLRNSNSLMPTVLSDNCFGLSIVVNNETETQPAEKVLLIGRLRPTFSLFNSVTEHTSGYFDIQTIPEYKDRDMIRAMYDKNSLLGIASDNFDYLEHGTSFEQKSSAYFTFAYQSIYEECLKQKTISDFALQSFEVKLNIPFYPETTMQFVSNKQYYHRCSFIISRFETNNLYLGRAEKNFIGMASEQKEDWRLFNILNYDEANQTITISGDSFLTIYDSFEFIKYDLTKKFDNAYELILIGSKNRSLISNGNGDNEKLTFGQNSTIDRFIDIRPQFLAIQRLKHIIYNYLPELRFGKIEIITLGNVSTVPIVENDAFFNNFNTSFRNYLNIESYVWRKSTRFIYTIWYKKLNEKCFVDERGNDFNKQRICTANQIELQKFISSEQAVKITSKINHELKILTKLDSDTDNTLLVFENPESKIRFASLSIGDVLFGPGIQNNTYITEILNNSIRINNIYNHRGEFLLTFHIKNQYVPISLENNFVDFQTRLLENNLYDNSTPFNLSLYPQSLWPNVSLAYFNGLIDPLFYKPYDNGRGSFLRIMQEIHYQDFFPQDRKIIPSLIEFKNDLFFELNAMMLLYKDRQPYIMRHEWLDYFQRNIKHLSRATDNVSVGLNVLVQTDMSGLFTYISGQTFTDPNLQLLAQTFNWGRNSVPAYAVIGTAGESRRKSWFVNIDTVNYPGVYGARTYDDVILGLEQKVNEIENEGGIFPTRSHWDDSELKKQKEIDKLGDPNTMILDEDVRDERDRNCEEPLFEIPLGEYNIQLGYRNEHDIESQSTTVQASFYKQQFNNVSKEFVDDDGLLLFSDSYQSKACLQTAIASKFSGLDDANLSNFLMGNSLQFLFVGVWKPERIFNQTTNRYEINWPLEMLEDARLRFEQTRTILYYTIEDKVEIANVWNQFSQEALNNNHTLDNQQVTFEQQSVICFERDNNRPVWRQKTFELVGYYGHTGGAEGWAEGRENFISGSYPPKYSDSFIDNELTFLDCLAIKAITAIGTYGANSEFTANGHKRFSVRSLHSQLYRGIDFYNRPIEPKKDVIYYCIYCPPKQSVLGLVTTPQITATFPEYSLWHKLTDVIPPGSMVGLYPTEENLNLVILNHKTIFMSTMPYKRMDGLNRSEITAIFDPYSSRFLKNDQLFFDTFISPITFVNQINTPIQLPRKNILDGQYDFNLLIKPGFIHVGYEYEDFLQQGFNAKEVKFNITLNPIFKDSVNNVFYTESYNEDDPTRALKRFVIKFEEQKYFKNILHTIGEYQVIQSQQVNFDTITYTPTITSIDGYESDVGLMSIQDRILQIDEINLRSEYDATKESKQHSNSTSLNGFVYGVSKNQELRIGYERTPIETDSLIFRNNFSIINRKFIPIKIVEQGFIEYPETIISWNNDDSQIEWDDTILLPAEISIINVYRPFLGSTSRPSNSVTPFEEFRYFKNLMLLEGKIAFNRPNVIQPSGDLTLFNQAIGNITSGDSVEAIIPLDGTLTNVKEITLKNIDPIDGITSVHYHNKELVVTTKSNKVYYAENIISLKALSEIEMREQEITPDTNFIINDVQKSVDDNSILIFAENTDDKLQAVFGINKLGVEPQLFFDNIVNANLIVNSNSTEIISNYVDVPSLVATPEHADKDVFKEVAVFRRDVSIIDANNTAGIFRPEGINQSETRRYISKDDIAIYNINKYLFVKSPTATVSQNGNYDGGFTSRPHWKYGIAPLFKSNMENNLGALDDTRLWNQVNEYYTTSFNMYRGSGLPAHSEENEEGEMVVITPFSPPIRPATGPIFPYEFLFNSDDINNCRGRPISRTEFLAGSNMFYEVSWTHEAQVVNGNPRMVTDFTKASRYVFPEGYRNRNEAGTVAWRQYVNDYIKYVLLYDDVEDLFNCGIRDIKFADNNILFRTANDEYFTLAQSNLTKRSDIENPANWNKSLLPEYLSYSFIDSSAGFDTTVRIPAEHTNPANIFNIFQTNELDDDIPRSLGAGLWEIWSNGLTKVETYFKILNTYIKNNLIILVGHHSRLSEIRNTAIHRPAHLGLRNHWTPMVLVSRDAGFSFEEIVINGIQNRPNEIFSTSGINYFCDIVIPSDKGLVIPIKHACAVRNRGYLPSSLLIPFDNGQYQIERAHFPIAESATAFAVLNSQHIADGTLQNEYSSEGLIISDSVSNKILLVDTMALHSLTPLTKLISRIENTGLTIGQGLVDLDNQNTETIRVLYGIKTKASILNATQYLDVAKIEEYVTDIKDFKIPTSIPVLTYETANLMFSFRETLSLDQKFAYTIELEPHEEFGPNLLLNNIKFIFDKEIDLGRFQISITGGFENNVPKNNSFAILKTDQDVLQITFYGPTYENDNSDLITHRLHDQTGWLVDSFIFENPNFNYYFDDTPINSELSFETFASIFLIEKKYYNDKYVDVGYPSLDEDDNHVFYNYVESDDIYTPSQFLNQDGQAIHLCDHTGSYILFNKYLMANASRWVSTYKMMLNGMSLDQCEFAGYPKYKSLRDADLHSPNKLMDERFFNIVNSSNDRLLTEINRTPSQPSLAIKTKNVFITDYDSYLYNAINEPKINLDIPIIAEPLSVSLPLRTPRFPNPGQIMVRPHLPSIQFDSLNLTQPNKVPLIPTVNSAGKYLNNTIPPNREAKIQFTEVIETPNKPFPPSIRLTPQKQSLAAINEPVKVFSSPSVRHLPEKDLNLLVNYTPIDFIEKPKELNNHYFNDPKKIFYLNFTFEELIKMFHGKNIRLPEIFIEENTGRILPRLINGEQVMIEMPFDIFCPTWHRDTTPLGQDEPLPPPNDWLRDENGDPKGNWVNYFEHFNFENFNSNLLLDAILYFNECKLDFEQYRRDTINYNRWFINYENSLINYSLRNWHIYNYATITTGGWNENNTLNEGHYVDYHQKQHFVRIIDIHTFMDIRSVSPKVKYYNVKESDYNPLTHRNEPVYIKNNLGFFEETTYNPNLNEKYYILNRVGEGVYEDEFDADFQKYRESNLYVSIGLLNWRNQLSLTPLRIYFNSLRDYFTDLQLTVKWQRQLNFESTFYFLKQINSIDTSDTAPSSIGLTLTSLNHHNNHPNLDLRGRAIQDVHLLWNPEHNNPPTSLGTLVDNYILNGLPHTEHFTRQFDVLKKLYLKVINNPKLDDNYFTFMLINRLPSTQFGEDSIETLLKRSIFDDTFNLQNARPRYGHFRALNTFISTLRNYLVQSTNYFTFLVRKNFYDDESIVQNNDVRDDRNLLPFKHNFKDHLKDDRNESFIMASVNNVDVPILRGGFTIYINGIYDNYKDLLEEKSFIVDEKLAAIGVYKFVYLVKEDENKNNQKSLYEYLGEETEIDDWGYEVTYKNFKYIKRYTGHYGNSDDFDIGPYVIELKVDKQTGNIIFIPDNLIDDEEKSQEENYDIITLDYSYENFLYWFISLSLATREENLRRYFIQRWQYIDYVTRLMLYNSNYPEYITQYFINNNLINDPPFTVIKENFEKAQKLFENNTFLREMYNTEKRNINELFLTDTPMMGENAYENFNFNDVTLLYDFNVKLENQLWEELEDYEDLNNINIDIEPLFKVCKCTVSDICTCYFINNNLITDNVLRTDFGNFYNQLEIGDFFRCYEQPQIYQKTIIDNNIVIMKIKEWQKEYSYHKDDIICYKNVIIDENDNSTITHKIYKSLRNHRSKINFEINENIQPITLATFKDERISDSLYELIFKVDNKAQLYLKDVDENNNNIIYLYDETWVDSYTKLGKLNYWNFITSNHNMVQLSQFDSRDDWKRSRIYRDIEINNFYVLNYFINGVFSRRECFRKGPTEPRTGNFVNDGAALNIWQPNTLYKKDEYVFYTGLTATPFDRNNNRHVGLPVYLKQFDEFKRIQYIETPFNEADISNYFVFIDDISSYSVYKSNVNFNNQKDHIFEKQEIFVDSFEFNFKLKEIKEKTHEIFNYLYVLEHFTYIHYLRQRKDINETFVNRYLNDFNGYFDWLDAIYDNHLFENYYEKYFDHKQYVFNPTIERDNLRILWDQENVNYNFFKYVRKLYNKNYRKYLEIFISTSTVEMNVRQLAEYHNYLSFERTNIENALITQFNLYRTDNNIATTNRRFEDWITHLSIYYDYEIYFKEIEIHENHLRAMHRFSTYENDIRLYVAYLRRHLHFLENQLLIAERITQMEKQGKLQYSINAEVLDDLYSFVQDFDGNFGSGQNPLLSSHLMSSNWNELSLNEKENVINRNIKIKFNKGAQIGENRWENIGLNGRHLGKLIGEKVEFRRDTVHQVGPHPSDVEFEMRRFATPVYEKQYLVFYTHNNFDEVKYNELAIVKERNQFNSDEEYDDYLEQLDVERDQLEYLSKFAIEESEIFDVPRFSLKNQYIYDNLIDCFPINRKLILETEANVMYTHQQASVITSDKTFNTATNSQGETVIESQEDITITGVYIDPEGYGGCKDNPDRLWKETLPWEIDPIAFEDEILINVNNDPVYLTDVDGVPIQSFRGTRFVQTGDVVTVNADDLTNRTSITNVSLNRDLYLPLFKTPEFDKILYVETPTVEVLLPPLINVFENGETIWKPEDPKMNMNIAYVVCAKGFLSQPPAPPQTPPGQYMPSRVLNTFYQPNNIRFEYKSFYDKAWTDCSNQFSYSANSKFVRYHPTTARDGNLELDFSKLEHPQIRMIVDDVKILIWNVKSHCRRQLWIDSFDIVYFLQRNNISYDLSSPTNLKIGVYGYSSEEITEMIQLTTDGQTAFIKIMTPQSEDSGLVSKTRVSTERLSDLYIITLDSGGVFDLDLVYNKSFIETPRIFCDYKTSRITEFKCLIFNFEIPFFVMNQSKLADFNIFKNIQYYFNFGLGRVQLKDLKLSNGTLEYPLILFDDNFHLGKGRETYHVPYREDLESGDTFSEIPYGEYRLIGTYNTANGELTDPSVITNNITFSSTNTISIVPFMSAGDLSADNFVIDDLNKQINISVKVMSEQFAILRNIYGTVFMQKPKYRNIQELIAIESEVISPVIESPFIYEKEEIPAIQTLYTYDRNNPIQILNIENRKTFRLTNLLPFESLNNGRKHLLKFKVLPYNASKRLTPILMNNPEHYIELTYQEVLEFGYDRIWFNSNGYLQPPVKIDNKIFREENNVGYKSTLLRNKQNENIFECDAYGRYISYFIDPNNELQQYVLGDKLGSLENDVKFNVDRRFQPLTPIYESCMSWFEDRFYYDAMPKNLFWQIIHFTSEYNSNSMKFDQKATLKEYRKVGSTIQLVDVPYEDRYTSIDRKTNVFVDGISVVINKDPFLDSIYGTLNFALYQPAEKYRLSPSFVNTGIFVLNTFFDKKSSVFTNFTKIDCVLFCNYTVNSIENIANINDKDSAIAKVTELALLDKNRNLIFYSLFPPIEYRTDSQHLSFTVVVRENSMIDLRHDNSS